MNMAAGISSAQCPKCSRSVGHWTGRRITHLCASCGAPLIRFKASRKLRLYRIIPVAELVRIAGSLVTVAAIVTAAAMTGGIRAAVFMVATALVAFGAADLIQETFAMRARGATGGVIINRPELPSWKVFARLAAGLACLMLGIVGFVVWASVTTNM
jgi:hypothetical protein